MVKYAEVLKSLKDNSLEEIVEVLLNSMEEGFNDFNFPDNCCDFATFFSGVILKDLGYEVKAYYILNCSHSYLVVNNKIVDFTIHQYKKNVIPGIIECENKNIYINGQVNYDYTEFIQNVSYDDIKKDNLNFVNCVILKAIDVLISKVLRK